MKKLAVFFPGIGYTVDKPLLHYSRRLAAELGYEIRLLPYTGFPEKVLGDRNKMVESYMTALEQSRKMLADVDFAEYEDVLFIGKSIGTIVSAQIASENSVSGYGASGYGASGYSASEYEASEYEASVRDASERSPSGDGPSERGISEGVTSVRQIFYTPLEDTFRFPFQDAIVFTGAEDPWVGKEKSPIRELCEAGNIRCIVIPDANHSLESADLQQDIKNLSLIMAETADYMRQADQTRC